MLPLKNGPRPLQLRVALAAQSKMTDALLGFDPRIANYLDFCQGMIKLYEGAGGLHARGNRLASDPVAPPPDCICLFIHICGP